MQTNPEQWAQDLFWAALKAGDNNNYEAAYAVIQAAFAEQNARLVGALEVLRDLPIVENDNPDTLHLKGTPHTGPVVDYFFKIVRMVKQVADQALKDRPHG